MVVVCWIGPDVALTVILKFLGGGGPLFPPHAAGNTLMTSNEEASTQMRRLRWSFMAARKNERVASAVQYRYINGMWNGANGNALAETPEASTVKVAFLPGLTEFGEMPQVGIGPGVVPLTEHASEIAAEKLPCAAKLKTSLILLPACNVRLPTAGVTVKSGAGLNVAVTVSLPFMVMLHTFGSVPEHAPVQPPKTEFPDGIA